MTKKSSGPQADRLYNLVSVLMLVLSALVVCGAVAYVVTNPPQPLGVAVEPTLFVFPSETPTLRGPTPNATWTPSPLPTASASPTVTRTPIPSITPTPTNTPTATNTMTPTLTPTATNTPLPTKTPLPPTRSPFDFVMRGNTATYTQNFANNAGCKWAGIAGTVFDRSGQHLKGMVVHVTGGVGNIDYRWSSGSNTAYGPSGWEQYLNNHPVAEKFFVQLEYVDRGIASAVYEVWTRATCAENLALVTFDQIQTRATLTPTP